MAKFSKSKIEEVNANTVQYSTDKGFARWHKKPEFAIVTRKKGRFECKSLEDFEEIVKENLLTQ